MECEVCFKTFIQKSFASSFVLIAEGSNSTFEEYLMICITKGVAELVATADKKILAMSPEQVETYLATAPQGVLLVDIRDIREIKREGKIPGSFHIPRGMLEFWIDPASQYYKSQFENAEELILYCNKGARSALATQTLMEMGVTNIAHMTGGFTRWTEEGREVNHS